VQFEALKTHSLYDLFFFSISLEVKKKDYFFFFYQTIYKKSEIKMIFQKTQIVFKMFCASQSFSIYIHLS